MNTRKLQIKRLNAKERNKLNLSHDRVTEASQQVFDLVAQNEKLLGEENFQALIVPLLHMMNCALGGLREISGMELDQMRSEADKMLLNFANKNISCKDALLETYKYTNYIYLLMENLIANRIADEGIEHNLY